MLCPKHWHETALKCIGRYLKETRDQGLILNPSFDVCKLDYDPDAYFSGMYGREILTDSACVKIRTRFVITFDDCPVYCASKFQTETALLTMESEINVSIHENNARALILSKTLPPQFTPRSKFYASKTIWFREEINKRGIKVLKIDTVEQMVDILIKGLPRATFEYLRKKIIDW